MAAQDIENSRLPLAAASLRLRQKLGQPRKEVTGAVPPDRRASRAQAGVCPVPRELTHVRGILAERIVVSTELDPFLSLKALASYSGLSVRTLRSHLEDIADPLPCYRVRGKILVRRSEFDGWMAQHRRVGRVDVDRIVSDVLKEL
jgi:hypothetical protein